MDLSIYMKPCRRTRGQSTLYTRDDRLGEMESHCQRLACNDCNPYITARRGLTLLTHLNELEQETVFCAETDDGLRNQFRVAKSRFNSHVHRKPAQSVAEAFYHSDSAFTISTHNLVPSVLQEVSKKKAVDRFIELGVEYKTRRVSSDWDLKPNATIIWLMEGMRDDVAEIIYRAAIKPGDTIEDVVALQAKLFRLQAGLKNGEEGDDGTPYYDAAS